MSKFIELTRGDEDKIYFNVHNICGFFWSEEDGETKVFMTDSDDDAYFIEEPPRRNNGENSGGAE